MADLEFLSLLAAAEVAVADALKEAPAPYRRDVYVAKLALSSARLFGPEREQEAPK